MTPLSSVSEMHSSAHPNRSLELIQSLVVAGGFYIYKMAESHGVTVAMAISDGSLSGGDAGPVPPVLSESTPAIAQVTTDMRPYS